MPPAFVHTGRQLGQGVPAINWGHTLAQSLLACYVPAAFPGGRIINLAAAGSGDLTTRTGVATGLGPTMEGPGLPYTGTATAQASGATPTSWQKNYGVSLFVRYRVNGQAANNTPSYLFGVASSLTPFNCYIIGTGGTTANGALTLFHSGTASNQSGAIVPTVGTMCSAGATFPHSADPFLYVNGVQDVISNVIPTNITYNGTITTQLGGQASPHGIMATPTVGYIWNRVLTAAENRYLDANPYALLLWPNDRVLPALATLAAGRAVAADAFLAAEFLESVVSDSGAPVESLAAGSTITGNAALPLEFRATVLRDWGAGAAQSMIRRFSRPALVGRVRRLLFPGRPGTLAIESEGRQHADPGAPIESLGSAGNSVAGDAMSPIETASSQRNELVAAIENTASLQVDPGAPAEALAASLLDINGPVEVLAGGITTTTDTNSAIEWVTAAPPILLSLESGPERVRLLATRGRVRLLRRR